MTKKPSRTRIVLIAVFAVLLLLGVYLLVLYMSPRFVPTFKKNSVVSVEEDTSNRLTIPSTGINVAIKEGGEEQLEHGAWHRFPERGNPEIGGNFILSGHSFIWGYTPWQVSEKSYFYNLKDVKVGDEVTVRWNSNDYLSKVDSVFYIDPSQTNIEDKRETPILTIYT